jgi:hypothetical protein
MLVPFPKSIKTTYRDVKFASGDGLPSKYFCIIAKKTTFAYQVDVVIFLDKVGLCQLAVALWAVFD